ASGLSNSCLSRGLRSGAGAHALRIDSAEIGQHVLTADDRRELAARLVHYRPDHGGMGRIDEESDRVAVPAVAVDHAVLGRREAAVGPALQQVGDVDHEGAVDWRHADPFAALVAHLEAAERVLPQDGEAAAVAVAGDADDLTPVRRWMRRIMHII